MYTTAYTHLNVCIYIYIHRNCIYTSAPDIPGCLIFPLRRRPGAVASESKEAVKALEAKLGEAPSWVAEIHMISYGT